MRKTSRFAATKMEKLALPASAEAWEGSGTLCLKTPSTGAASQLSRGFRACKQPWVHQETIKLVFSWDTFFGQKAADAGVGDSRVAGPALCLPQEPPAHSSPCWQPGLCPRSQTKPRSPGRAISVRDLHRECIFKVSPPCPAGSGWGLGASSGSGGCAAAWEWRWMEGSEPCK